MGGVKARCCKEGWNPKQTLALVETVSRVLRRCKPCQLNVDESLGFGWGQFGFFG